MKNRKILAIIPARGGSKRIPRKNIKSFLGFPIIKYSIDAAVNSGLFDEVMVSTDDKEIARTALKYGAKVPFYRSAKNSDDHATTSDVIFEVLKEYKKKSQAFDTLCCIYPAAPFVNQKILKEGYTKLIKNKYYSVFPLVKYGHPIQRAFYIKNNKVVMCWPENLKKRTQDMKVTYHDAGQFYWINTKGFLDYKSLVSKNSGFIILDDSMVQDIDNTSDWKMAELKYKLFKNEINYTK